MADITLHIVLSVWRACARPVRPQAPLEQVWEDILNAEQTNTQNLLNLAAAADRCGQYGCMAFLNDFHLEQIEAEETVGDILNKVRSGNNELLMQLDYDLGKEAESEDHH